MNARHQSPPMHRQRGLAAIEFALVFTIVFIAMYGLATFGVVLYTQQAVSRAAEEGARSVVMLTPQPTAGDTRVKDAVYDALANSLVVPSSAGTSLTARRNWIVAQVSVNVSRSDATGGIGPYIAVSVSYPYNASTRVLPSIPLIDTAWMPQRLQSRSTATLKSS